MPLSVDLRDLAANAACNLVAAARRRYPPEVEVAWKFTPGHDPSKLVAWERRHSPALESGTGRGVIQVAARNVGGPPRGPVLGNLVVPDTIELRPLDPSAGPVLSSTNEMVGAGPDRRVTFARFSWALAPGNWYLAQFAVTAPAGYDTGTRFGALLDLSIPGASATGATTLPRPFVESTTRHTRPDRWSIDWATAPVADAEHRLAWRHLDAGPDVTATPGARSSARTFQTGWPGPAAERRTIRLDIPTDDVPFDSSTIDVRVSAEGQLRDMADNPEAFERLKNQIAAGLTRQLGVAAAEPGPGVTDSGALVIPTALLDGAPADADRARLLTELADGLDVPIRGTDGTVVGTARPTVEADGTITMAGTIDDPDVVTQIAGPELRHLSVDEGDE